MPERLTQATRPSAEIIDFAAARQRRRGWTITGLAAAASLALGLTVGVAMPRGDGGSFTSAGERLAASGPLAGALDRQLASAGDRDGIRIGLSFKDGAGRYCRSFTATAQSGLACRDGGKWSVEGLVAGQPGQGDYRMAAGADPALGELIDSRIAGEPLDAVSEERLARQGWKD